MGPLMVEDFLERSVALDNGVDLRRNRLDHEIQPRRQSHEPAAFVPKYSCRLTATSETNITPE